VARVAAHTAPPRCLPPWLREVMRWQPPLLRYTAPTATSFTPLLRTVICATHTSIEQRLYHHTIDVMFYNNERLMALTLSHRCLSQQEIVNALRVRAFADTIVDICARYPLFPLSESVSRAVAYGASRAHDAHRRFHCSPAHSHIVA